MRSFSVRMSAFFGAYFFVVGVYLPFFPVWLASRGLTPGEIGVVVAIPLVIRVLFTPAFAVLAGRFSNIRTAIAIFAALGAAPMIALHLAHDFFAIAVIVAVSALFWNPVLPLAEALAMAGVRRGSRSYGRMRMWGSWAFIAANFGCGWLLARMRPEATILIIATCFAAAALVSAFLKEPERLPDEIADTGSTIRDSIRLFAIPALVIGVLAAALLQASHGVFYAFGSVHWAAQGISYTAVGALWAVGVLAEIVLFALSARLSLAFGPFAMLALAAVAGLIRWTAFSFSPGLAALFLLQILHGFTFGAAHLGIVRLITAAVPERHAAAGQAFYFTVSGLLHGLATLAAGALYTAHGGGAYLAMTALSLAGGGLALAGAIFIPVEASEDRVSPQVS